MENMKNKNLYLIACVSCIVLLMTFCYFGINSTWKATYSAETCPAGYKATPQKFGSNGKVCVKEDTDYYTFTYTATDVGGKCVIRKLEAAGITACSSTDATLSRYGYVYLGNCLATNEGRVYGEWTNLLAETDGFCITPFTGTLTATIKYEVEYNMNSTSSISGMPSTQSSSGEQGKVTFTAASAPTGAPAGKVFAGWNTKADGSGKTYQPGDSILTSDTSIWYSLGTNSYSTMLYAKWSDATQNVKYSLSYNKNTSDSSVSAPNDHSVTGEPGKVTIKVANAPTGSPSGKSFLGWNTKTDGSGKMYQPGTEITSSDSNWISIGSEKAIYLNAIWGNEETLKEKSAVYTGSPIEIDPITVGNITNITYTYYTNNTCTTKTSTDHGASAAGKAPVDVGTYWVQGTHLDMLPTSCVKLEITKKSLNVTWGATTTFTYNGSQQGPSASVSTGVSGETMTLNASKAKDAGDHTSTATCGSVAGGRANCNNYSLTNTSKAFKIENNNTNPPADDTPKENTYTAFFDDNGGLLVGDNQKSCNTTSSSCKVNGLPTAEKDGYTFKGWDTSSSCTSGKTSEVTISKNTTFYACYTKNETSTDDNKPTDDNQNVNKNPNTGDITIAIIWFIGLLAIGYSFHYFKSIKEN